MKQQHGSSPKSTPSTHLNLLLKLSSTSTSTLRRQSKEVQEGIIKRETTTTMDEAISHIIQGCKLARDLESSLPNLANQLQPDALSSVCEEIIRTFTAAKEKLNAGLAEFPTLYSQPSQVDLSLHDWGMSTSTMELLKMQLMAARGTTSPTPSGLLEVKPGIETGSGSGLVTEFGGRDVQAMDALNNPAGRPASSQRPRKRKNDAEKLTVWVSAPQMGNTEIPPEDGFTWRKYGQKEILGARFPRGYYRCTHQKLYNCPAKKQVQRLDDDPHTYEISYRGEHTCHMTATAPSIAPPPKLVRDTTTQIVSTQQFPPIGPSSSSVLGGSLGLNLGTVGGAGTTIGTGGAGPSTSVRPYGKESSDLPVADMAVTMFNTGSSSSNSMDFIFTQNVDQDKSDPLKGEKRD